MNERDFQKRLLAAFNQEAGERLDEISKGLLDLENRQGGSPAESLEITYRAAHSLKGAARAVGLGEVERLCQAMESVLRGWKKEEQVPSPQGFNVLHQAISLLGELMDPDGAPAPAELENTILMLERGNFGDQPESSGPGPGSRAGEIPTHRAEASAQVKVPPEPSVNPRPAPPDPSEGIRILHPVTRPVPEQEQPGHAREPRDLRREREITGELTGTSEFTGAGTRILKNRASSQVKVMSDRLDALLLQVEGALSSKLRAEHLHSDMKHLRTEMAQFRKEHDRRLTDLKHSTGNSGNQAAMDMLAWMDARFHSLEKRLKELNKTTLEHSKGLGRMVDSLMHDTKQLAMQPFGSVMSSFPRMIRDIAGKEGKSAVLEVLGEAVEMDKRILDDLKDPLTHILRNCVDHGLEYPGDRAALGKPEQGLIRVAVNQLDSSKVELLVQDDGRGIRPDKIRAAARKSGVIPRETLDKLTDEECIQLIFESGLSSAPIVTDISGHGLGLAIVRQKVEELGGRIFLSTEVGKGTTFRIHLPVTRATFRGVVVEMDRYLAVIPASSVSRVARVNQDRVKTVEGQETFNLDQRVIPLVRLETILELRRKALPGVHQDHLQVVVLKSGSNLVGFAVDRVVNEQEVLVKGLGPLLVRVKNVAAATVLGSGRVVPILNVPDLIRSAETVRTSRVVRKAEEEKKQVSVLVAEDSITSRMLLKNILESAGYKVKTAVDGAEALASLRTESFDVLVSDVEMPRLSGLELTEKVRADKRLSELPVILVTAREDREDKERGIEAGANAYIVKSSFDQSKLLETIKRFI